MVLDHDLGIGIPGASHIQVLAATTTPKNITSFYRYTPTEWICILFLVLFSLSCLTHLTQSLLHRIYWLIPTACFCGILEILGWSARLWSSFEPSLPKPYEMHFVLCFHDRAVFLSSCLGAVLINVEYRITCTILGPTPLIAANFVILGRIIEVLGVEYSRISPRMYSIIFVTCDVISLVVQGLGGGMAAAAVQFNKSPVRGGRIMLGGIVFQLTVISVYVLCGAEFFTRYFHDAPIRERTPGLSISEGSYTRRRKFDTRLKIQIIGLMFMTVCLWIRSVYRTIELADGWMGRIITTQVYFNVLDGAMVTLAMFALHFAHPGVLLGAASSEDMDTIKLEHGPQAKSLDS